MLEKLPGLGKFFKVRNISDSDFPFAKHVLSLVEGAPRTLSSDKYFFLFAAFASLREIIRNSVAALPREVFRGNTCFVSFGSRKICRPLKITDFGVHA